MLEVGKPPRPAAQVGSHEEHSPDAGQQWRDYVPEEDVRTPETDRSDQNHQGSGPKDRTVSPHEPPAKDDALWHHRKHGVEHEYDQPDPRISSWEHKHRLIRDRLVEDQQQQAAHHHRDHDLDQRMRSILSAPLTNGRRRWGLSTAPEQHQAANHGQPQDRKGCHPDPRGLEAQKEHRKQGEENEQFDETKTHAVTIIAPLDPSTPGLRVDRTRVITPLLNGRLDPTMVFSCIHTSPPSVPCF